ncbi:uncharacterized protein SCHCODRAFT_02531507 [Schizophyllum commune H4-8]|uniref:uncharacterized protein n=1 Tax=Schizophyllum commune (strain H4-8 / FGSC 9210) TaxID=578458 RepID=UPI00215E1A1D|nr:uncharacterized protein SCHCODRAFT_02531507 [Schizophyllum commune H4-8]KAI5896043.1 hypothetical protein SCHCODRAFT_02531507 [Schizophyllum commune H4-8]
MPHRCLGILDITQIICEDLFEEDYLASLSSLAATCSYISDTALDVLWKEQNSLVPLLRTLPENLLTVAGNGDSEVYIDELDDQTLTLVNKIPATAWTRIQSYARRVRCLRLGEATGGTIVRSSSPHDPLARKVLAIDISVLDELLARTGGHPLFPRLQYLYFRDIEETLVHLVLPLSRLPPLTDVEVYMSAHDGSTDYAAFLERLLPVCPDLQTLSLTGDNTPPVEPELLKAISDAACACRSLKSAHLLDIDPRALAHLARTRSLSSLKIGLNSRLEKALHQRADVDIRWDDDIVLSDLVVEPELCGQLETLLNALHGNRLKVELFHMTCYEECDCSPGRSGCDPRVRNLELLAKAFDPAYMNEFAYVQSCDIPLGRGSVPASHVLQLATGYPKLTWLIVDCWVALADDDLTDIARALPQLELLMLDTRCPRPELSRTTRRVRTSLAALKSFAHYCPDIRYLSFWVNAARIPSTSRTSPLKANARQSVRLHFAESKFTDDYGVAGYLRHVFPAGCDIMLEPPEYEGLDDDYDPPEGYSDGTHKWIAVKEALRVLEKYT